MASSILNQLAFPNMGPCAHQRIVGIITRLRNEYDGYRTTSVILQVGVDLPRSSRSTGIVKDVGRP